MCEVHQGVVTLLDYRNIGDFHWAGTGWCENFLLMAQTPSPRWHRQKLWDGLHPRLPATHPT